MSKPKIRLVTDQFLTNIFGIKSYKATFLADDTAGEGIPDFPSEKSFVYASVTSTNPGDLRFFIENGFYFVCENQTFLRPLTYGISPLKADNTITIRQALPNDQKELLKIVENNPFVHSRVFADQRIPRDQALKTKLTWLSNFFRGERGTKLLIAEIEGGIAGFNLIIEKENQVVIDLIATGLGYKKRGVGSALIRAMDRFSKEIQVSTQASNISAINLYIKNGFRLLNTEIMLHRYLG